MNSNQLNFDINVMMIDLEKFPPKNLFWINRGRYYIYIIKSFNIFSSDCIYGGQIVFRVLIFMLLIKKGERMKKRKNKKLSRRFIYFISWILFSKIITGGSSRPAYKLKITIRDFYQNDGRFFLYTIYIQSIHQPDWIHYADIYYTTNKRYGPYKSGTCCWAAKQNRTDLYIIWGGGGGGVFCGPPDCFFHCASRFWVIFGYVTLHHIDLHV